MIKSKKIDTQYVLEKLKSSGKLFEAYSDHVIRAYLFGSIYIERITPLSDIDIAVLYYDKHEKCEFDELENKIYMLLSKHLRTDEIGLINLNTVPLSVQFGIIKDKRILYYSDFEKMIDFENKVIMNYLDIKHYRDEFNSIFIESLI